MTVRERRRQQARSRGGGLPPIKWGKIVFIALLLLGATAVVGTPFIYNEFLIDDSCPGHWHSTMKVYVNETEVDFTAFNLESGNTPISSHFHRNDARYKWHFEPAQRRCIPLREAISHLDVSLSDSRLVLDGLHEPREYGGTHTEAGDMQIRAYHKVGDGEWRAIGVSALLDRQLRDGERVLVLYGNQPDDRVRELQDTVPDPYSSGLDINM